MGSGPAAPFGVADVRARRGGAALAGLGHRCGSSGRALIGGAPSPDPVVAAPVSLVTCTGAVAHTAVAATLGARDRAVAPGGQGLRRQPACLRLP